jgi:hypothetical protein
MKIKGNKTIMPDTSQRKRNQATHLGKVPCDPAGDRTLDPQIMRPIY